MRLKNKTKEKMHLAGPTYVRVLIGSVSAVLALWWGYTGETSHAKE